MSFVVAAPDAMSTVAQDLAGIHSSLSQVTAAATGPTTAIVAAAEDEVSAAVAALFGTFGQEYHAVGGRAAAFHEQFVGALNGAAGAYASTELANAQRRGDYAEAGRLSYGVIPELEKKLVMAEANAGRVVSTA